MNKFYIYPGNNSYLIKEGLQRRGNWQEVTEDPNHFQNCNFIWKPTNLTISEYNKLDGIAKAQSQNFAQVFNHFENIRGICTKTGLIRSLKKYYSSNLESKQVSYGVFDSTPTSFLITAGVEDFEYSCFLARYREIVRQSFTKESIPQKHCEGNYWLVKPANLNQGRGIEVFKTLKDINSFLGSKPHNSFWVIQKYIERPLLYQKRKFDIRIWVVVTAKNEIFLYNKAYIRTSSDEYDLKASKNYVHLTNNCLQQFGENYGKFEDGNTLPLDLLDQYIKLIYPEHDVKLASHVIPRIRDLIIDTFLCTKSNLNPAKRKNVFELFGYDFLIDEDLRTWLIEVNTNPYLGIPNNYIATVLPNMIDDMLEIVVDPLFPPQTQPRSAERPNGYQLIYCEEGSSYHQGPLNLRSPFTKNVYPIQALVPPDFWKKLSLMEKAQEPMQNYFEQSNKVATVNKNNSGAENEDEKNLEDQEQDGNEGGNQEDGNGPNNKASPPEAKGNKGNTRNNIEAVHKQLCLTMIYKTDVNPKVFSSAISMVLSHLENWELLSDRDIKLACKILTLIAQSPANYLLTEQVNILAIIKMLRSNDIPPEIQFTVIETINLLSKDTFIRKKLICNHLFQNLIAICLSSCDEKEIQNYTKGFLMATLKCLVNLGGTFNRKFFVPGETRESAKLRSFFIAQGGIIAVWIISQKSLNKDMREYCLKNFLNYIELSDWEKQLQALDLVMAMPNPQLITEGTETKELPEDSDPNGLALQAEAKGVSDKKEEILDYENEPLFYRTGEFQMIEKALIEKREQSGEGIGRIINFSKEMLDLIPPETLRKQFLEYINNYREELERREAKEREKRQMIESEKQKKEETRKKELEEQRKQAIESFERRVKENLRRQQMELEQKQKKLEEIKQREIELRKKNIETLMNKKAEREKKKIRIRTQRQQSKTLKENFNSDEAQEKEEAKGLKIQEAKEVRSDKTPELHSAGEKSKAGPIANVDLNVEGQKKEYETNGNGTNLEGRKDSTVKNLAPLISDSHRSSIMQVANQQYFLSPTATTDSPKEAKTATSLAVVSNVRGVGNFKSTDSTSLDKERKRERSTDSFKLPKIQKPGRVNKQATQNGYSQDPEDATAIKIKLRKGGNNMKSMKVMKQN